MVSGPQEAARVAERLLEVIRQPVALDNDRTYTITASLGLSLFPLHANSPAELLRLADIALYRAKEVGGTATKSSTPACLPASSLLPASTAIHPVPLRRPKSGTPPVLAERYTMGPCPIP